MINLINLSFQIIVQVFSNRFHKTQHIPFLSKPGKEKLEYFCFRVSSETLGLLDVELEILN